MKNILNGGIKMSENYKFFQNNKCEYFPCHKIDDTENFNCLFCYCPLYALGDKCGGNFKYLNDGKIKDCSEHPADRALPGRCGDRGQSRARRHRSLPAGVRLPDAGGDRQ